MALHVLQLSRVLDESIVVLLTYHVTLDQITQELIILHIIFKERSFTCYSCKIVLTYRATMNRIVVILVTDERTW
jgi:hypothetical protein